jgi:Major Facilitator Superfamily
MYRHRFITRLGKITHVSKSEAKDIGSFLYHASGLLVNRFILKAAFGFVNVFTPIILFQKFGLAMVGVYLLTHIIVILTTPLSAMLMSHIGVRPLIAASVPFAALSIALLGVDMEQGLQGLLFAISLGLATSLYWVPYHVDLAEELRRRHRGAIVGWYENILEFAAILTPFIGGIMIVLTGIQNTAFAIALLCLTAIIPVYFIEEVYERFSWGYIETFKKVFSYKHRKILLSYGADGAQMAVATIFWPIFIFFLFNEKYAAVGFVTSLSMVFILALNAWLGHMVDTWGHAKVLKVGTFLEVTGWFMKAFVVTPFHVFVTDTYHKFGDSVVRFSKDFSSYRTMADNGHYIDEYTTLAEISFRLGKIIMLIISAVIITWLDIRHVFIFTAVVSVLFLLFKDKLIIR